MKLSYMKGSGRGVAGGETGKRKEDERREGKKREKEGNQHSDKQTSKRTKQQDRSSRDIKKLQAKTTRTTATQTHKKKHPHWEGSKMNRVSSQREKQCESKTGYACLATHTDTHSRSRFRRKAHFPPSSHFLCLSISISRLFFFFVPTSHRDGERERAMRKTVMGHC